MVPLQLRNPRLAWALLLLPVLAAGCGGSKEVTVRGKVTYRGAALAMGNVVMVSADGKTTETGQIQADGSYQVTKVPVGPVKVAVVNPPPIGAPGGQPLTGSPNDPETKHARTLAARYVRTPPQYADPQKSGLSYQVPPGGGTFDIELK